METSLFPHLALTSIAQPLPAQDGSALFQCLTVYLGFSLLEKGSVVPVEEALQAAGSALCEGSVLDLGLPKQGAEWLCAGCAMAKDREAARSLVASIRVGSLERSFLVLGDRVDDGLRGLNPQPFERMPLDWKHTYGGPGFAENPKGVGALETRGLRPLPNVLALSNAGEAENFRPACPMPQDMAARSIPKGTFDAQWLARHWPAPPVDFDWSWYNLAQREQIQKSPFEGLEEIRVLGMHEKGELHSSLPGLRVRLFAQYADKGNGSSRKPGWYEFAAAADTVWLFPNKALGLQLWHALVPTLDERGSDIQKILVCHERVNGPRNDLHTLLAMKAELDTAEAMAAEGEAAEVAQGVATSETALVAPSFAAPQTPDVPQAGKIPEEGTNPVPGPDSGQVANAPAPSLEEAVNTAKKKASEDLPELLLTINPILERQGMRPLSVEEVEREIARQAGAMKEIGGELQKADMAADMASDAFLDPGVLRKAGLPADYGERLERVLAMTPPRLEDYASMEAYDAALASFGDQFASLANAPSSVRDNLVRQLKIAAQGKIAPTFSDGPDLEKALHMAGLKGDGKGLEKALSPLDSGFLGDAAILSVCQNVALALGIDPGLVTGQMTGLLARARQGVYQDPALQDALQKLLRTGGTNEDTISALLARVADMPKDKSLDLAGLAKECGVSGALCSDIQALDPLPAVPLPKPADSIPDEADTGDEAGQAEAEAVPDPQEDPAQAPKGEDNQADHPGITDFSGQNLSGTSLAGLNLAGALFDGANLSHCDFSGCNLEGADFSNADLSHASLAGACLDRAELNGCRLKGTNLSGARARDADFSGCIFEETVLSGLDASEATFTNIRARGADFSGCLLSRAYFAEADLAGARMDRALLEGTTFETCTLQGCSLANACMNGARIYFSSLDDAALSGASLVDSNWLECRGRGIDAYGAHLEKALFETCVFHKANLAAMTARECRFLSCDLFGSDLRGVDLLFGALRDCRVGNCDVRGANLFGADLMNLAVNERTRLQGANLARTSLARGAV